MTTIGNSPTQQSYTAVITYFQGNGSTTAFTLPYPVATSAQIIASVENVVKNPAYDFTVSGNTITFTTAPPANGAKPNNIWIEYTSLITQVIAPSQGTVSPSTMSVGAPSWDINGNTTFLGAVKPSAAGVIFSDTSSQTSTSLGYSPQSYNNVTASRAALTTYTNSTGRPILVSVWGFGIAGATRTYGYVNTVAVACSPIYNSGGSNYGSGITFIVPNGATYYVDFNFSGTPNFSWFELR